MRQALDAPAASDNPPLERLAATCKIIVEAPGTIDLSPPYAVRYGGIGVVAKIARNVFVGAEPIASDRRVEFGEISHFVPEAGHYQPLASDRRLRLEQGIPESLHAIGLGDGIRIHIVSELPFYRGLNIESALAIGIAAVLLLKEEAQLSMFERVVRAPFKAQLRDTLYQELFGLAWRIEVLISKYRPEGHHLHGSLTAARGCTVFWRDSRTAPEDAVALVKEDPFDSVTGFHPSGCCLSELTARDSPAMQPAETAAFQLDPLLAFDLAAVFVGREVDTADVYAAHRRGYRKNIDAYAHRAVELLSSRCSEKSNPRFGSMHSPSDFPQGRGAHSTAVDNLMDLTVVKSMEILAALVDLSAHGATRDAVRSFVVAVDQAHDVYRLFDLSSGILDEACHLLRSELRELTRQKVGVRLMGAGRGGCLLVVASKGTLAAALPMSLERVRAGLRLPPHLPSIHWASFDEGYASPEHGVRVVQYDRAGRWFPFRTHKSLQVREWVGGELRSAQLYERSSWQERRVEFDVILEFDDEPHLWLRGRAVHGDRRPGEVEVVADAKEGGVKSGEVSRVTSRRRGVRRGNPAAAPGKAMELLERLFGKARTGSDTVELTAEECAAVAERYRHKGSETRRTLKMFLGEEVMKTCGIDVDGDKPSEGAYTLSAHPEPTARLALVWRWSGR